MSEREPMRLDTAATRAQAEPEECPQCRRLHRGERVEIKGSDGHTHWTGCVACWGTVSSLLPKAFELVDMLRTILTFRAYDPAPMRAALAEWDRRVGRIEGHPPGSVVVAADGSRWVVDG